MYSIAETQKIFQNCQNWEELEKACDAFVYILEDHGLSKAESKFINELATARFIEIENLET